MALPLTCVSSAELGKARRIDDAGGRYIEFCKSTFPNERDLKGWRIVVDCAHGAGYHVAPPVFHELGAEVIAVGAEPDGININAGVGATHPEHLRQAVLEHGADLGVALDGDGDRLVMADSAGSLYDGDQLLYVIAMDYRRRGALAGGVVGTLMSNLGFEQALTRAGVALERAPVGDRYVLERMNEKGWLLGGENSGHLLCLDKHTTGDAIVAALAVLRALNGHKATLAQAAAPVTLFPQRLINVRMPKGFDWKASTAIRAAEADARTALGSNGRILLRPSGTEPVLRVMVEALDRPTADACAERVADSITDDVRRRRGLTGAATARRYNASDEHRASHAHPERTRPGSPRGSTSLRGTYPDDDIASFRAAHAYARTLAADARARDGEPLALHAAGTAAIVAALKLDAATVRAALLIGLPAIEGLRRRRHRAAVRRRCRRAGHGRCADGRDPRDPGGQATPRSAPRRPSGCARCCSRWSRTSASC